MELLMRRSNSDHNNAGTAEFICLLVDSIDGRTEVGKFT